MGSLSSSPKVPKSSPQVVYIPAPTATQTISAASSAPGSPSAEEAAAQVRTENLLLRNRGRFGTVLNGFRGFLSPSNEATTKRKTLLGE